MLVATRICGLGAVFVQSSGATIAVSAATYCLRLRCEGEVTVHRTAGISKAMAQSAEGPGPTGVQNVEQPSLALLATPNYHAINTPDQSL